MTDMTWHVWSEGYRATGDIAGATYHGLWSGDTFADACATAAEVLKWGSDFDPDSLTLWACKLFDNEKDARRSFG